MTGHCSGKTRRRLRRRLRSRLGVSTRDNCARASNGVGEVSRPGETLLLPCVLTDATPRLDCVEDSDDSDDDLDMDVEVAEEAELAAVTSLLP